MGQDLFQIDSYSLVTSAGIGGENAVTRILQLRSAAVAHGYYSTASIWGGAVFAGHVSGNVYYEPTSTQIVSVLAFLNDLALDELVQALTTNRGGSQFRFQFDGDFGTQTASFDLQWLQISEVPVTAGIGAAMTAQIAQLVKKFPELKGMESRISLF